MSELKQQWREVLAEIQGVNFTDEQLEDAKYDLQLAQTDLDICKDCRGGKCRATANTKLYIPPGGDKEITYYGDAPYYFALHEYDSKYFKWPSFRLFPCPSWVERKAQIQRNFTRDMEAW